MSTLATADLGPSDDEADTDFVLPAKAPKKGGKGGKRRRGSASSGSDSSDDDDDGEPEEEGVAKLRAEAEEVEAAARRARAAAAFEEMKAEAMAPRKVEESKEDEEEMVEVQRPRRFAGETVFETVRMKKSDPEAIKLLRLQKAREAGKEGESNGTSTPASVNGSPAPVGKKGPRRKRPRQSLEALAAAIDGGKKMTTLEKSQMDWNSHVSRRKDMADELAANRKSGGYLEKQAFLDRVEERRDAKHEAAQSSRRR